MAENWKFQSRDSKGRFGKIQDKQRYEEYKGYEEYEQKPKPRTREKPKVLRDSKGRFRKATEEEKKEAQRKPKGEEAKPIPEKPSSVERFGESGGFLSKYTVILKITAIINGRKTVYPYSLQTNKEYLGRWDLEEIKNYLAYKHKEASEVEIKKIEVFQRIDNEALPNEPKRVNPYATA